MKILITGMGSHHCKKPDNVSFFSVLDSVLSEYADVVWSSPSVSWKKEDLEKYDHILFGFLPPTSLNANKIYGALNVLSLMFDSPKLKLIVDSPQVWQYKNSIAASTKNPSILLSSFYSRREGYQTAIKNPSFIEKAFAHMMVSKWPKIIYPSLPWNSNEKISSILGFGSANNTFGLNLDSLLIKPETPHIGRKDYWAVENIKNSWVSSLNSSVSLPMEPTKASKKTDDFYALDKLKNGIGLIVPPQERNLVTWWNYRIIQALNTSTPVVTYWPETANFNYNWAMLAYQIEDMSPAQRQQLAAAQRGVYIENIPSKAELYYEVDRILIGSTVEEEINA